MEWFINLFSNVDSIAHIVLIYALVVAMGVWLGKIKFGGISLGVTFVLFAGILVGHLYKVYMPEVDFAAPHEIMHFAKEFGLILFVYCIGLQVGPGFFAAFKGGGVKYNLMAISIVVLNILTMLALYYLVFDTSNPRNLPMMVGVLYGAVTNTPGLGAATQTLNEIGIDMGGLQISSGYACAYPLGVVGIILSTLAVRWILRINLSDEEAAILAKNKANAATQPVRVDVVIRNVNINGKTLAQISQFLGRSFVLSYLKRGDTYASPTAKTILQEGDLVRLVCAQDDLEGVIAFLGELAPERVDWDSIEKTAISRRVVVTKENVDGKTLAQLGLGKNYDVSVTRVFRSGTELFARPNLRLQMGDTVMLVGEKPNVKQATQMLGNSVKHLDHPNVGAIFIGIMLGMILGSLPIMIPGIPNPVKLGLAGGPLIVAILLSRFGYKLKIVSYTTPSANLLLREVGLILFLASVGLEAGSTFWSTLSQGDGLTYVWTGFLITTIPLLIVGLVARTIYKVNYFTLMGLMAGSCTDPPALAFAQQQSGNTDAASVGYATVYPLTMFLRIISAQIILLFLCA